MCGTESSAIALILCTCGGASGAPTCGVGVLVVNGDSKGQCFVAEGAWSGFGIAVLEILESLANPECCGTGVKGEREGAVVVGGITRPGTDIGAMDENFIDIGPVFCVEIKTIGCISPGRDDVIAAGSSLIGVCIPALNGESGAIPDVALNGELAVNQRGVGIDDDGTAALHIGSSEGGIG